MFFKTLNVMIAIAMIAMCGPAFAQDCNGCGTVAPAVESSDCGGGCAANDRARRCGRAFNNAEAAALWTNYCNEDCSFGNGNCGCNLGGKLSGLFQGRGNRSCGLDGGHFGGRLGGGDCGVAMGAGDCGCGGGLQSKLGGLGGTLGGLFGNIGCGHGCGCDAAPVEAAPVDECGGCEASSPGLWARMKASGFGSKFGNGCGCSIKENIGCGHLIKGDRCSGGKLRSIFSKFGNRGGDACGSDMGCDTGCFGYPTDGCGCGTKLFGGQFLGELNGLHGSLKAKMCGGCGPLSKIKGKFASSRAMCGCKNAYFGEIVGHEYGTDGMQSAVVGISNCCDSGSAVDPSYGQAEASAHHHDGDSHDHSHAEAQAKEVETAIEEEQSALQKAKEAVEALEDAVNK